FAVSRVRRWSALRGPSSRSSASDCVGGPGKSFTASEVGSSVCEISSSTFGRRGVAEEGHSRPAKSYTRTANTSSDLGRPLRPLSMQPDRTNAKRVETRFWVRKRNTSRFTYIGRLFSGLRHRPTKSPRITCSRLVVRCSHVFQEEIGPPE